MTRHSSQLLLALTAFALVAALPAEARTRTRTVERERGASHRETAVTNNQGQTTTHTADRTWDRATQTTLPDGRTAGRTGTFQKNADGSTSAQGTYQRFNGNTGAYTATSEKTDTGRTSSATLTRADGQTATLDSTTTRTADGFERVTTKTGPEGHSVTKDVDVSHTAEGTTRTVTRTTNSGGN